MCIDVSNEQGPYGQVKWTCIKTQHKYICCISQVNVNVYTIYSTISDELIHGPLYSGF